MSQYKLVYFDLKGRAEVSRILFLLGDQQFTDERNTFESWKDLKPTLPFLQAPVLEVTENSKTHRIAQSHAIERFLANRFNLMGKTDIERAQCDMICEQIVDLFNMLVVIYRKQDSEEKTKELDEAIRQKVPPGLKLIQNLLEANTNGKGYLVGDSLTLADVQLVNFYDWLRARKGEVLDQLPALKRHDEFIHSLPKLGEHLKKNANVRVTILFKD